MSTEKNSIINKLTTQPTEKILSQKKNITINNGRFLEYILFYPQTLDFDYPKLEVAVLENENPSRPTKPSKLETLLNEEN